MRKILLAVLLCLAAAIASAQSAEPASSPAASQLQQKATDASYRRPDKHERYHRYFNSMFGLGTLGKNIFGAGISTWSDSPEEWGSHWQGFGKRFASNMGKGVIKNTATFGLEETFRLDSRYIRTDGKSVGYRIEQALISPFVARNEHGHKVFGFPRIAGTYAASIIAAETWYPKRFGWRDGLKSGTVSLGTNAMFNLVKEFIHRK
jgi:hypothetical protein